MNNCSYEDKIFSYIDDDMLALEKKDFEDHLKSCENCRNSLDNSRLMISSLNDIPEIDLPKVFHETCMKSLKKEIKIHKKQKYSYRKQFASIAAAFLGGFIILSGAVTGISHMANQKEFQSQSAEPELSSLENDGGYVNGEYDMQGTGAVPSPVAKQAAPATRFAVGETEYPEAINEDSADSMYKNRQDSRIAGISPSLTIKIAHIQIVAGDFDYAESRINSIGITLNEKTENYGGFRTGSYAKEITKDQLNFAMEQVKSLGDATSSNLSESVVYFDVVDASARLFAKQTEYDRLLGLMNKTDTIADMNLVDQRLNAVIYEMDDLNSSINSWNKQAENSVLYIELTEKPKTVEIVRDRSLPEEMQNAFVSSVNFVSSSFEALMVVISALIIPIIIIGIIIVVIILVNNSKKRRGKNE